MKLNTDCKKGYHFKEPVVCAACEYAHKCNYYLELFQGHTDEVTQKIMEYIEKYKDKYKLEVLIMAPRKSGGSNAKTTVSGTRKSKEKMFYVITEKGIGNLKTEKEVKNMFEKGELNTKTCRLVPDNQLYQAVLKLTIAKCSD